MARQSTVRKVVGGTARTVRLPADGRAEPIQAIGPGQSPAPAVTRAAAVLDLVAAAWEPVAASALARQLELPKSSILNICGALVDVGFLIRSESGYELGRKLVELGGAYLARVDEVQEFYRACKTFRHLSRETVQLSTLDGIEVIYLARHDGQQRVRLASDIGTRVPATCTGTGKAMLAQLEPAVLNDRLRGILTLPTLTAKSLRTIDELLDNLDIVRERDWAIDDEETTEGIICFAVPVPGLRKGTGLFAVSTTLLKARATDELRLKLVAELHQLAARLGNPMVLKG